MKTKYTVLPESNQLIAERSFSAPKSKVWQYYTTAELLDKWWGPLPYKAVTKSFDFREGGHWHYVMQGPEGDAHYCVNNYKTISPEESFTAFDGFAHEDWSINRTLPGSDWEVTFTENGDVTEVKVVLTCADEKELSTLIEMGMKEGFNQGLDQLEALLENN
ncbi:SRPBCC domain-containing protein [Candidatus Woesebacteria bacterium]|nr:SRPBCC domain-containing protein [Candidatus Woesebacteria bacterium]